MSPSNSAASAPIDLYLDLLKRSRTGTIFDRELEVDDENSASYIDGFIKHYINGAAISMLPLARFDNLQACVTDVINSSVPGDLTETGVWRGGAVIFMRAMLKAFGVADRTVWVPDSFPGLPKPDAEKFSLEAKIHEGIVMKKAYNHFAVAIEDVRSKFEAYCLLDEQVRFLKGWFKDTLPGAPIERLSIMRLDGDYYEATVDALTSLYDKLSVGGFVIIDYYAEDTLTYCRKAVDAFRIEREITEPLVQGHDTPAHSSFT